MVLLPYFPHLAYAPDHLTAQAPDSPRKRASITFFHVKASDVSHIPMLFNTADLTHRRNAADLAKLAIVIHNAP